MLYLGLILGFVAFALPCEGFTHSHGFGVAPLIGTRRSAQTCLAQLPLTTSRRGVSSLTQALAKGKGKGKKVDTVDGDAPSESSSVTIPPAQILAPSSESEEVVETIGDLAERKESRRRRRSSSSPTKIDSTLRFKLLEEQAQPLRRLRQFLYIAAGGSAGIGSFVSGTRIIAALTGVQVLPSE